MSIRRWVAFALVLLPVSMSIGLSLALGPRLPSPMSTTVGFDGHLGGLALPSVFLLFACINLLALTAFFFGALLSQAPRTALAMYAAVALFFAVFSLGIVILNAVGVGSPPARGEERLGIVVLLASILLAVLGALAVAILAGEGAEDTAPARSLSLDPGESAVWCDSVTLPAGLWIAISIVQIAYVCYLLVPPAAGAMGRAAAPDHWVGLGILLLAMNAVLVQLSRLTIMATHRGVRIALGPWRWPRWTLPAESIRSARPCVVAPLAWAGWGVRLGPRGLGLIMRRGPGIRISRDHRLPLVVSSTDATRGAAFINAVASDAS